VLIFLNGLPSCPGATDASSGESREIRRKGLPIVNVPNALFLNSDYLEEVCDFWEGVCEPVIQYLI